MGNQFRDKDDQVFDEAINAQESQKERDTSSEDLSITDDAFKEAYHVRSVYRQLCIEYDTRITPKFANITKIKAQFPPYWDEKKNAPAQLPLYQHNVGSGRYTHSITQLSLTFNSFFPNQSYNKSLLDLKILEDEVTKAANSEIETQNDDNNNIPTQASDRSELPLMETSALIEQAYDNVIKHTDWAKREHLKMVSDMVNYGVGLYYFSNPDSYTFKHIDFRKTRFPSGTTTDPKEWEYMFLEHDMSFFDLVRQFEKAKNSKSKTGWDAVGLGNLLMGLINPHITRTDATEDKQFDKVENIDQIREGLSYCDFSKVCPARIPVVTCYWKTKNGKISTNTFANIASGQNYDFFIFSKDNIATCFCDIFSIFPGDDTETELRMVRGWGEKIFSMCHAYDRAFSKFLDHMEHAATLFLKMDPADLHKKILHYGSMNIGSYEDVQNMPNALNAIIAGLAFLDAKIDSVTFTRGLNKTELMGEGRGAELAGIILTTEGRVHKSLMSRFIERYTSHHRKTLSKIINISLTGKVSAYPEVESKFKNFLENRNVPVELYKLDDTSEMNDGLPSHWQAVARKPDGTGITGTIPHALQVLQPYLSSLPEGGFKYLISRIIADVFGDEDMVDKILPGADISKLTSEADLQIAEMQAAILTASRSEFDRDFDLIEDIDPLLSDASKFATFPSSNENDHIIFLQVLLGKVDDITERFQRQEFGQTTFHIWLFNLVSTSQGHVQDLQNDQVRSKRPESQALVQRWGNAFNLLRQVESQANAERQRKISEIQEQIAQQEADDPKRMEAEAKLITAKATAAKVAQDFSSDQFDRPFTVAQNRRAEEAHVVDQILKGEAIRNQRTDRAIQVNQSLVGRPSANEQRGSNG